MWMRAIALNGKIGLTPSHKPQKHKHIFLHGINPNHAEAPFFHSLAFVSRQRSITFGYPSFW
jgi:hypothetical protein